MDYGASVFFNLSEVGNTTDIAAGASPDSLLFTGSVNIHNFNADETIDSWTLSWIFAGEERVINVAGAALGGNVPSVSLPGTQVSFEDLNEIRTAVFPGGSIIFNFIGESAPDSPHVRLPFKLRFNDQECAPISPPDTMFRSDVEALLDERQRVAHDSYVVEDDEILRPPPPAGGGAGLDDEHGNAGYEFLTDAGMVSVKLLPINLQANSPYTPSEYYSPFLVDIEIASDMALELDEVVFQYWFAGVHGRPDPWLYRFVCYRAENLGGGCDDIIGVIAPGVSGVPGAELVLQVSFAKGTTFEYSEADAFFLSTLTIGSITIGIEVENYALIIDDSNDWSNNDMEASTSFEKNSRMPAFVNGTLVWGVSPYSIANSSIVDVGEPERHVEARCENPLEDDGWSCNLFAQFCCGPIRSIPPESDNSIEDSLLPAPPPDDAPPIAVEEDEESGGGGGGGGGVGIWIGAGVVSAVIFICLVLVVVLLYVRSRREGKPAKRVLDIDTPPAGPSLPASRTSSMNLSGGPPSSSSGGESDRSNANAKGMVYYTTPVAAAPSLVPTTGMAPATAHELQLPQGSWGTGSSGGGSSSRGADGVTMASVGNEISVIKMPPGSVGTGDAPMSAQWNVEDGRDASNLIGSRLYIEAPVDRDTPVSGSLAIDFDNEILLESILGSGAFGSVYRGRWRGKDVAVKLMASQGTSLLDSFHAEVEVLSRLQHPNIVRFLGASVVPPHLCLVEELVENGSLWNLLHSEKPDMPPPPRPLSLMRTLDIAEEIASALAYIHPTIVHRDLKSGNVLLDRDWHAKIADFGIARFKNNTYMTTHGGGAGTAAYMAPELFSAGRIDEKSDIFSLGVLIWEMYQGEIPWNDCTHPMQVVMAIGINGERLRIPDEMPKTLAHIVKKCWREDAHRRPSATDVVRYIQKERRMLLKEGGGTITERSDGTSLETSTRCPTRRSSTLERDGSGSSGTGSSGSGSGSGVGSGDLPQPEAGAEDEVTATDAAFYTSEGGGGGDGTSSDVVDTGDDNTGDEESAGGGDNDDDANQPSEPPQSADAIERQQTHPPDQWETCESVIL